MHRNSLASKSNKFVSQSGTRQSKFRISTNSWECSSIRRIHTNWFNCSVCAMAAPIRVLFRGGTVLTHDDDDHVIPIESDLLVEGKSIKEISPSIQLPTGSDVKVVDCKNKIVSPGFISTHQHLWQSLCKSLWSEFTILEYLCLGRLGRFQSGSRWENPTTHAYVWLVRIVRQRAPSAERHLLG